METTTFNNRKITFTGTSFLNGVFGWMGLGLALTSFISYFVYASQSLLSLFVNENGMTGLGYVIMFAPIGFVLLMSFGFNKLSHTTLIVLFLLYATLMGASLSFIFLVYTNESIYSTFLIAALMYSAMGLIGYFTKTDLTKLGNILLMILIGVIIASLVNLFMKSDSFSYAISFISVILFCGLTAWDVQKIKSLANDETMDSDVKNKSGILGALTLYLDFINLFLSLLRLFGRRKES